MLECSTFRNRSLKTQTPDSTNAAARTAPDNVGGFLVVIALGDTSIGPASELRPAPEMFCFEMLWPALPVCRSRGAQSEIHHAKCAERYFENIQSSIG